jgi:putative intracellular protease/amidase
MMKILMVLTSHSELGDTGKKTGFWIEEFASPYYVLVDAGAIITIASPKGGQPPVDPKSEEPDAQTAATKRFFSDLQAIDLVANSVKLSTVHHTDYDAVFYPGGHGPLWDLANDKDSIALIEGFYYTQKPISFVCHAPAALINAKAENGEPLVKGKMLTAFSNTEEDAVGLTAVVPFSLESELVKNGAQYFKANNWESFTEQDGLLITGQNPASSEAVAKLLLKTLIGVKKSLV